jgi:hypothetical protein
MGIGSYIYFSGSIVAFILGIVLIIISEIKRSKLSKEEKEKEPELQYGMIAPLVLLSWFSVFLICIKYKTYFTI